MAENGDGRLPRVPLEQHMRERIVDMYRRGKKTAEITAETGAARSTIYYVLREEGITPARVGRSRGVPRGVELPPSEHERLLDWALGEVMRLKAALAVAEEKLRTIGRITDS